MSTQTLSKLGRSWPTFDFEMYSFDTIRSGGKLSVAQSKSGGGMVLLQGIEVKGPDGWVDAHLSFPPDKSGTGTFSEGHLKIEGGKYLNQYFFSCDENESWEVEKLANSPTVKTVNPGKWDLLGTPLWNDIDKLVTVLAYRPN